jgi:hypothetical protein
VNIMAILHTLDTYNIYIYPPPPPPSSKPVPQTKRFTISISKQQHTPHSGACMGGSYRLLNAIVA